MKDLKPTAMKDYFSLPEKLGKEGLHRLLDLGKRWNLSQHLQSGGGAIFPHASIAQCGDQISAVVNGCLDSGTDQVLVLGVVHPTNDELIALRQKEKLGELVENERHCGIFTSEQVKEEFSLFNFETLWKEEIERRGMASPRLIKRYPFLVNRRPDILPGIEELLSIAKDSVLIATADLCHYGAAYDHSVPKDINFAKECINKGFEILKTGDYDAYLRHCWETLSDSMDTCTILHYLKGIEEANVLDLKLVDVSNLFVGDPKPSWVATSLIGVQ